MNEEASNTIVSDRTKCVVILLSLFMAPLASPGPAAAAADPAADVGSWPWGMRAATFFRPVIKDTDFELEDRIGLLKRLGYDTLVIGVQHFPLDHITNWAELQGWSARITTVAHRHGMKTIEHHSAGVFHTDHLDDTWQGRRLGDMSPLNITTGKPDIYIKTMIFACPNNPQHWEIYSDYARQMLVGAGVDGYMADDVEILKDVTSCACTYCRAAFRERYGAELPEPADTDFWRNHENAQYRKWLRFRQQSVGGFHRRMRQLRDKVAPGTKLLTCQCQPAGTGLPVLWALAHDEIAPDMDVLFLEACNAFGYFSDWAFWACDAKLLQAFGRGEKPVFPLYYPASVEKPYVALFSSPEARRKSRPRGYYSNEVSKTTGAYERVVHADPKTARGRNEFFFIWAFSRLFADGWWVGSNFDLAAEGFAFGAPYASLFRRTGSVANVALHYSRQTRDFYGGLGDSFHVDAWRGWAMALLNENVPFDVFVDEDLVEPIPGRTALLILPNSACLSDKQVRRIRGFVKRGGRVIATGDTSLYTEDGTRRREFALADTLGVRHVSTVRAATGTAEWARLTGQKGGRGQISASLGDDVTITQSLPGATVLGELRSGGSGGPVLVLGASGAVLYVAAKPGLLGSPQRPVRVDAERVRWRGLRDPDWHRLLLDGLEWGLPDGRPVRLLNPPRGLILAAAANGPRTVVQLLNATGAVRAPGQELDPNECVFPDVSGVDGLPIRLQLRLPRPPSRVRLLSPDTAVGGQPLGLEIRGDGACVVTLPTPALRRYALVVCEPGLPRPE